MFFFIQRRIQKSFGGIFAHIPEKVLQRWGHAVRETTEGHRLTPWVYSLGMLF